MPDAVRTGQDGLPLVSCIMPTADRRLFVPRAIDHFRRQDYSTKELIIVDDGTDPIGDLVPADERIRYLRLARKLTLGEKRNLACEQAHGEIILHWDDDDWMADWRVRYQVDSLLQNRADVCGLDSILFYNPASGEAWRYVYPKGGAPWLAGGTLCYGKSVWRRNPFPAISIGEDARFVWSSKLKRLLALPDSSFYVAFIHPGNTSPKHTHDRMWHPISTSEVEKVMGTDWPPTDDPPEVSARGALQGMREGDPGDAAPVKPLVSCVMATRNRRPFIPQAIRYFLNQSYPAKELVILDNGSDPVTDLVPDAKQMKYIRLDRNLTLGEKRNLGVEASHGDIVVLWDDDDWHAAHRLSYQVDPIIENRADATVLQDGLLFDLRKAQFWQCRPALRDRMFAYGVIGGTVAFRKNLFNRTVRFPQANLAEDAAFLRALFESNARVLKLPCNDSFLYVRHHCNTWNFATENSRSLSGWQLVDPPSFLSPEDVRFYASLSGSPPMQALATRLARSGNASDPKSTKGPTTDTPLSAQGAALYRQGAYEEALDCLERASQVESGNPWIGFDAGLCLLALNRPGEALGRIESALAGIPSNTWVFSALGRAHARLGHCPAARQAFERARQISPGNDEAVQFLEGSPEQDVAQGRRLRAERNLPAALTFFDAALVKDPENSEALAEKGRVLRMSGQSLQALPYLVSAMGLHSNAMNMLKDIAETLAETDHPDLAGALLKRAFTSSDGRAEKAVEIGGSDASQSTAAKRVLALDEAPALEFIKQLDTGVGSLFEDYVFLHGIARLLRPRTILEVGTNTGVSTIVFAKALEESHILGKITTIDIDPEALTKARLQVKRARLERYVEIVEGNSLDVLPQILKASSCFDLCLLDGDHEFETVSAEFELVRAHCRYILLHDTSLFEGVKRLMDDIRKRPDCRLVRLDYPPGEQWSEGRIVRRSSPGFALIEIEKGTSTM